MKKALIILALGGAIWAGSVERSRVRRSSLVAMEQSFDQRLTRLADDPYLLVGNARGLYLDGYGSVFTAEVSLANGPGLSPFHTPTREDMARIRAKKLERLPALRQCMRDALLAAAASIDDTPANEQIVVAVSLINRPGEDTSGIPGQILMQGVKSQLLDAKLGRVGLESAVKVREY